MKAQKLLYNNNHRLRTVWRIFVFCGLLSIAITPLLLIDNSRLQFFGALLILIYGLYLNSKYLDKIKFSDYGLIFKKKSFVHLFVGILIGCLSVLLILTIGQETSVIVVNKSASPLDYGFIFFRHKNVFSGRIGRDIFSWLFVYYHL